MLGSYGAKYPPVAVIVVDFNPSPRGRGCRIGWVRAYPPGCSANQRAAPGCSGTSSGAASDSW